MKKLDPYQELANAIIVSASKDYMRAYKKYLRTGLDYGKVMKEERFFFTDWFNILSDANPDYLVSAMRKKCEMQVEDKVDGEEEEMTLSDADGHLEEEVE